MKYIGPATTEEVQVAYMARTGPDSTGIDANDPRHERWCHPVVPEDGAPGELELRLAKLGVEFEIQSGPFGASLLYLGKSRWIPRWPDRNGMYGIGSAPQYAIRNDINRFDLDTVVALVRQ